MIFRELEKVGSIIREAISLDISYAYEDLVFAEHGVLIIQFNDDNPDQLYCYFHKDCIEKDKNIMLDRLISTAKGKSIELIMKGSFSMEESEKEGEFTVSFDA